MMYDKEWGDIVSLWLEEDYRLTKKKRRTNKNYFELLEGLGFLGSYRTVCSFVQEWKSTHHNDLPSTGYERLEHPPAEAQLDFGTMEVEHEGSLRLLSNIMIINILIVFVSFIVLFLNTELFNRSSIYFVIDCLRRTFKDFSNLSVTVTILF